jgi:hypothetical protein
VFREIFPALFIAFFLSRVIGLSPGDVQRVGVLQQHQHNQNQNLIL